MLEELFPRFHRRYAASPFSDHLCRLADWLASKGYAKEPAHNHVRRLRQVFEAFREAASSREFSAQDLERIFAPKRDDPLFRATRRAYERCLSEHGLLRCEPDPVPHSGLIQAYRSHLLRIRGLSESTVAQHVAAARWLLEEALPVGASPTALDAAAIERHVVSVGQRISRQSMQHRVAQMRSFLRFCYDSGVIVVRLDAIDTPRTYRGELPPRALSWKMVQALLQSIDRKSTAGWRDHAILHLMAYYGLRPSEIAALRLDSIDWQAKTIRIEQRKTRSALLLPLVGHTAGILRRYLYHGRPGSDRPELFLRARTPAGPIKHTAVVDLYKMRALKSGLPIANTSSYSLRHSFAMRLLNRGVGIKAIGDVLGHRSLESTCVYLRLHMQALRDAALPLPRSSGRTQ
jgi:integrase/recombinase XerD